jgi:putative hydrolase of the HAD superfamily
VSTADDAPPPGLGRFRGVDAWVFDLDNTLYPSHTDLFGQIDVRIRAYVERLLDLGPDEAQRLQKDYYRRFGTTLRGLMSEHGVTPDEFLDYVHDIDHSVVAPDPRLAAALARLPGRRFIMTNGSRRHAERVAERLGITAHFDDIFDIVSAEHLPKPLVATYERFWLAHGIVPEQAAMFEDLARNLEVPHARGMRTVLIVPEGTREVFREDWELEGRADPHVEHVTDDLAGFLERVLGEIGV